MPSIENIYSRIHNECHLDPKGDFYMSGGDIFYHQGYDKPVRDIHSIPICEDLNPFNTFQEAFDYFCRTYGDYIRSLGLFIFLDDDYGGPHSFIDIRRQDDIDSDLFIYQALSARALPYARTILEEFVNQVDIHYPTEYGMKNSFMLSEGYWSSVSLEEFRAMSSEAREDAYITAHEVEDIIAGDHPDAIEYVDAQGNTSSAYNRHTFRYSVLGDRNVISY